MAASHPRRDLYILRHSTCQQNEHKRQHMNQNRKLLDDCTLRAVHFVHAIILYDNAVVKSSETKPNS